MAVLDLAKYKNGTASALVKTGEGALHGIIVNSHTGGTIKFWDSLTAATTVLANTYTFPSGSGTYMFPPGIIFTTGLYATVGGTLDYTIIFS